MLACDWLTCKCEVLLPRCAGTQAAELPDQRGNNENRIKENVHLAVVAGIEADSLPLAEVKPHQHFV